jgi:hypothetical protein
MNSGVPRIVVCVCGDCPAAKTSDRPKSFILINTPPENPGTINTRIFSGLRSRCAIPFECICDKPSRKK